MGEWFASGRVFELIFVGMALEGAGLVLFHRVTGRGIRPARLLPNLASGMCLLLAMSLSACSVPAGQVNGQVLEETSKQSIKDAIVVVTWEGTLYRPGEGRRICYHVETTRTDASGKFQPNQRISAVVIIILGQQLSGTVVQPQHTVQRAVLSLSKDLGSQLTRRW